MKGTRYEMSAEREAGYDANVESLLADPPPELRALKALPGNMLGGMREIMKSGMWLSDELLDLGCPDEEVERLGHAHGQLCFGANPWAMAGRVLDGYKAGRPEQPGPELARQIFDERVVVD